MKKNLLTVFCLLVIAVMIGCGPSEEELATQIADAVVGTVETIPTATAYPTLTPFPEPPTATPYPTLTSFPAPTPYPTLTPFPTQDLTNLFCSYGFCIGHPTEAYLVDLDAPDEWSSSRNGSVIGIEDDNVMGVFWQTRTESEWNSEEEVLDLIEDDEIQGEAIQETIGNTLVAFAAFNSLDPDTSRPYRLAAAWHCGNRGFTLLLFSKKDGIVLNLMRQSIDPFTCQQ
jgi:hypothetical protein